MYSATTAASHTSAHSRTARTLRVISCESLFGLGLLLFTLRVLDGLINGEDSARGLGRGTDHIDSNQLRLPNKELVHV